MEEEATTTSEREKEEREKEKERERERLLETFLAVSEDKATKFKRKRTTNQASSGKKKKFTLKKLLDSSARDDVPLYKANWSNIEVGPSLKPQKKYSDLSGFESLYTDPKTRLRYSSIEEYKQVRSMSEEDVQARLALRGADYVIK